MACNAGAAFCKGESALAEAEPVAIAEASEAPASSAAVSAETTEVAAVQQAVVPGTNDLIAQTFSMLDVELTSPQPGELSSRSVRTVAINTDGTPVREQLQPPAPLVAEADVAPSSASEEPVASAAPVVSEEPVSEEPAADVAVAAAEVSSQAPEPEPDSSLAYAPASGDVATVTGKGANVRSVPAVGGSEVLFALPGGEEVTIVQMSKGWAKIVDSRSRSGWIYGQYLNRG